MAITNISKPSTTIANSTKASDAELWSTITTTWASETRTWLDCVSLMTNVLGTGLGYLWSARRYPWTETTPWLTEGGITNVTKPA